jgi:hypothetical protein
VHLPRRSLSASHFLVRARAHRHTESRRSWIEGILSDRCRSRHRPLRRSHLHPFIPRGGLPLEGVGRNRDLRRRIRCRSGTATRRQPPSQSRYRGFTTVSKRRGVLVACCKRRRRPDEAAVIALTACSGVRWWRRLHHARCLWLCVLSVPAAAGGEGGGGGASACLSAERGPLCARGRT